MEYVFELEVSGKVEDVVETLLQVSQPSTLAPAEHRAEPVGNLWFSFPFWFLRQESSGG
jgi:hypothetical protein